MRAVWRWGRVLLVLVGLAGLALLLLRGRYLWPDLEHRGGTLLVYEVAADAAPNSYQPSDLARAVARRLGASWRNGITVRPDEEGRLQVGVPRVGDHAAALKRIKGLLRRAGALEFPILANEVDDRDAVDAAWSYLTSARTTARVRRELERRDRAGRPPPPPPAPPDGFHTPLGSCTYGWVELGRALQQSMNLDDQAEKDPERGKFWLTVADARSRGETVSLPSLGGAPLYSRARRSRKRPESERAARRYEYFLLCRDPQPGKALTGADLKSAAASRKGKDRPGITLSFTHHGGQLLHELTSANLPAGPLTRYLAVVLDGRIVSIPGIKEAIRENALISGSFSAQEVDDIVMVLRAGALPARLEPNPVEETTVEPN
jgi:preprotein translocase subunit SecD